MRRHAPNQDIPADARGASIALGNFDGVHKGHQAVIAAARAQGGRTAGAVFAPHPRRVFNPDAPPFLLQNAGQRARAIAALGVHELFEIAFREDFAQLSGEDFARYILKEMLGARHVAVGEDFRFGRGRERDAAALAALGQSLGFGVTAVAPVKGDGARISSTAIRDAIQRGDVGAAAAMLTRPWAIEGVVARGFQRGRGFGFATANVALGDYVRPRLGIYAVRVRIDGAPLDGVASVGVNPTVGALPAPVLEAHVFDFDRELYGQTIEVEMIAFLREEAHFADVEALKAQMARDAAAAKAALAGQAGSA